MGCFAQRCLGRARLPIPEQVCVAHFNRLRQRIGEISDANASASEDQRRAISLTDAGRIIDEVTQVTDPSVLQQALAQGLCEAVDFMTPHNDDLFYVGTDVTPGHVAAGLPYPRDEVSRVSRAVDDDRAVLVVGPSGSGKSAVLWMSAYEHREAMWYRVRTCSTPEDVAMLTRLARGLMPTQATPIGFVVDNVGRPGVEAWDELVAECSLIPGVLLVGASREEDLFLVSSLAEIQVVRLSMDEGLAEGIWRELRGRGKTPLPHWIEAFTHSGGLLLEYMHILSAGTRLQDIVGDQVRVRRAENRDLELRILSIAGTANAWAVEVPLAPLVDHLSESEEAVAAALDRLVSEHLIQRHPDGSIQGLHRLRSEAIFLAVHNQPPPTMSASVSRTSALLPAHQLRSFLVGVLTDFPQLRQDLISDLAAQFAADASVDRVVAAFQAFRTVEFIDQAKEWVATFDETNVPPAMRSIVGTFVLMDAELSTTGQLWDPRVREAVEQIRGQAGESPNFRRTFLACLPEKWLLDLLLVQRDCQLAAELLAAASGLGTDGALPLELPELNGSLLAEALETAPLEDVASVLSAARGVSVDAAVHLADCLGGPDLLLERVRKAEPWCQRIDSGPPSAELLDDRIDESLRAEDLVARVEYRFISDRLTPDPHDAVVRLASLVLACHPQIELVRAVALDARNRPYGTRGLELASKWLRRSALPSTSEIAWNRLRLRMIASMVAADTLTERVVPELQLATHVTQLVRKVATIWLTRRGNSASNLKGIDTERRALVDRVDGLALLPVEDRKLTGPLDQGLDMDNDPLQTVLRSCLLGVIDNLAAGSPNHFRMSALLTQLISRLDEIASSSRWQVIGLDDLPDELRGLRSLLVELHDISSELADDPTWGTRAYAIANQAKKTAVTRAAKAAQQRSVRRLETSLQSIRAAVERPDVRLDIATRGDPDNGLISPQSELLLMVAFQSLERWTEVMEQLVSARQQLSEHRGVWSVPIRGDSLVTALAVKLHASEALAIDPGWEGWEPEIPQKLTDPLSEAFFGVWNNAVELSAVASMPNGLSDVEAETAEKLARECQEALDTVMKTVEANPASLLLQEVGQTATAIAEELNSELDNSATNPGGIAREALDIIDGQPSDLGNALVGTNLLLIEYAVDPGAAENWYGRLAVTGTAPETAQRDEEIYPDRK